MPTTSPDNIYYPNAATNIAPLETQFANLATSVQAALTAKTADTGWITLYNNGDSMQNAFIANEAVAYRRKSGVVYLRGQVGRATVTSGLTVAFTLPVGFRPPYRIRGSQLMAVGVDNSSFSIDATGQMSININTVRASSPSYHLGAIAPWTVD